jgi:hypothetical protein
MVNKLSGSFRHHSTRRSALGGARMAAFSYARSLSSIYSHDTDFIVHFQLLALGFYLMRVAQYRSTSGHSSDRSSSSSLAPISISKYASQSDPPR